MFGRTLVRAIVLGLGAAAGLTVVALLAMVAGIWSPDSLARPPSGQSASAAVATATPATTPLPTPTPQPGVVQINSLAEVGRRASSLAGKPIRVVVGEQELTDQTAQYLKSQGLPISNTKVRLRPGQIVMTGSASQGPISVDFTVTGHPVVSNGALKLAVDSVDPSLLSRVAPIAPGQTIDLPMSFEAQSADVLEGQMVVTGVVR